MGHTSTNEGTCQLSAWSELELELSLYAREWMLSNVNKCKNEMMTTENYA